MQNGFLSLAVWRSGNALVSINEVTLCGVKLVLGWVTISGVQLPLQKNLSEYITNHQVNSAWPSICG